MARRTSRSSDRQVPTVLRRRRCSVLENGLAEEAIAIPAEVLATVLVPVRENPSLDVDSVDLMVVGCRVVRMPMNEGGVAMIAQEVVGRSGVEVHQMGMRLLQFLPL